MGNTTKIIARPSVPNPSGAPTGTPCIMVIFGAGGDVTKRLMIPAIYNLACDGLLPDEFAIVGADLIDLDDEQFRARLSDEKEGIRKFHTRKEFNEDAWNWMRQRLYYVQAKDLDGYARLRAQVKKLQTEYQTPDNVLFYFAVSPKIFGLLSNNMVKAGFKEAEGWRRIIVEKPFGTDVKSAQALNQEILGYWAEDQIYRVDHYLGKETVQNLLAFRFANGMYEPMWNKNYIDNIQFNVAETVDVEGRGDYYDHSGVLRDMMQNHMFQMLAYLCMEPPASFEPDAIRNEKAKLLQSVRVYTPEEVKRYVVRGQYGPELGDDGAVIRPGYRQEKGVNPESKTETFAAARFHIDNWRWEGVPIYLRSGKALWKRGTEIVVQFKRAPHVIFRGTPVERLGSNRLIFHIQPFQGIETMFHAKIPGPTLRLQTVHMKFDYGDSFKASRYTGYEVMVYSCMNGDATLFSRTDLVETAWKIAQPLLDSWATEPVDFPNYARGSWGPRAAAELLGQDGRRWFEVVSQETLKKVPLFKDADSLFLGQMILSLRPKVAAVGEMLIHKGDIGKEMYLLARGQVEVIDGAGNVLKTLKDGDIFGEIGVLMETPRVASVRAKTGCDLYVLAKSDFSRILRDNPHQAESMLKVAQERYNVTVAAESLMADEA